MVVEKAGGSVVGWSAAEWRRGRWSDEGAVAAMAVGKVEMWSRLVRGGMSLGHCMGPALYL